MTDFIPPWENPFTQDILTRRRNTPDGNVRIGQEGRLWYDSNTNTIRVSDGETEGGILVFGSVKHAILYQ